MTGQNHGHRVAVLVFATSWLVPAGGLQAVQLKVACVQMREHNNVATNVNNTISHIQSEAAQGTNVVVFPECSLTGYDSSYLPSISQSTIEAAMAQVAAACDANNVYAIVGSSWYEGGTRYNAATVIGPDGQVVHRFFKMHEVGGMRDVMADGNELAIFDVAGVPATIFICHDERYPEIMRIPTYGGARMAFYISSEAYALNKEFTYRCQIVGRAIENQSWVISCNAPMGNDSGDSHGQSRIMGPDGTIYAEAGRTETVIGYIIDPDAASGAWVQAGATTPLLSEFWGEGLRVLQSQNLDYFGSVTADPTLLPDQGVLGNSPSASLKIACVQMRMHSDIPTNAATAVSFIASEAAQGTRVVVFPECALTDRNLAALASVEQSQIDAAVAQVAAACAANNVYAIVGAPFRQEGALYNGAYVIDPNGAVIKRHAQLHGNLPGVFTEGQRMSLFKIDGVYATVMVGHDIHFPELNRLAVLAGTRMSFYLAYEPAGASVAAMESQVVCRAVESQTFAVFCNAGTGNDAGDSTGHSRLVGPSPSSAVYAEAGAGSNVAIRYTLSTGSAAYKWATEGYDTPPLQTYWQEGLDIIRANNPEFYGDVVAPPDIAEVSPDPDTALANVQYVKQLTLLAGFPAPSWSVADGPAGTQVSAAGRVSGWTPTSGNLGSTVRLEIRATNSQGSDSEVWYITVKLQADIDGDGDVDQSDFGGFQTCLSGSGAPAGQGCDRADLDRDGDVDSNDGAAFQACMAGPRHTPGC